jgi:hypothetical protein
MIILGLTTYLEYHAIQSVMPESGVREGIVLREARSAMALDEQENSLSLFDDATSLSYRLVNLQKVFSSSIFCVTSLVCITI